MTFKDFKLYMLEEIVKTVTPLSDFKVQKSRFDLYRRGKGHRDEVEFIFKRYFSSEHQYVVLNTQVYFHKRIHRYHKWFKPYYIGNPKYIKAHKTISSSISPHLERKIFYINIEDEKGFEVDFSQFKQYLSEAADLFFSRYSDLKNIYQDIVVEQGIKKGLYVNSFNPFIYLAINKEVASHELESNAKALKNHMKRLIAENDYGTELYYPHFDKILADLREVSF